MDLDLRSLPWGDIPEDAPPDAQISEFFQVWELYKSETAARRGIPNRPHAQALRNAVFLARNILDPVRNHFGPYTPNSVYRSQLTERALKRKPWNWISTSQHTDGCAADIEVGGVSNLGLATWIRDHLVFDQLILECYRASDGPNSGWVHVSLEPKAVSRHEVLSYAWVEARQKYDYFPGFVYS